MADVVCSVLARGQQAESDLPLFSVHPHRSKFWKDSPATELIMVYINRPVWQGKKKTCFTGTKYSSFREAQEELELLGIASDTDIPEEASAPGASVKGQCRNMERMPSNRHVKQGVYFRTNLSHFSFCRYFLLGSSPQKFGARTEYSNPLL